MCPAPATGTPPTRPGTNKTEANRRRRWPENGDPSTGPLRSKLVQTLLNSYMVQFLETGFLHADPHPGNFLLMPDGRLCILDYGMMTEISADQRVAFIEYIAHLSARDYDKTLTDLVNLGFVPPELAEDPRNLRFGRLPTALVEAILACALSLFDD